MIPGMVAVAMGIAAIVAAGGIIAGSVACEADADCPTGQGCRETPAAAGRLPYSQCVSR
jgi:hypothetical protein